MGVIRTLGRNGDVETPWDPKDMKSVVKAKMVFNKNKDERMLAFLTDDHGVGSEEINTFKPDAKEIIFTKSLVGG